MIIFTEIQNLLGFSCQQNYASCYNPPAKLKSDCILQPLYFCTEKFEAFSSHVSDYLVSCPPLTPSPSLVHTTVQPLCTSIPVLQTTLALNFLSIASIRLF